MTSDFDASSEEAILDELHTVEFMDNPSPRVPCVLLLDTSGSMGGEPLRQLSEGVRAFKREVDQDPVARTRVEVAVVAFNDRVELAHDFATIDNFVPPELRAGGQTWMGTAISQALDLIEQRQTVYSAAGVSHYKPWIFLITDGAPAGEPPSAINDAAERLKAAAKRQRVNFWAIGTDSADFKRLAEISPTTPARMQGLRFEEFFVWVSRSLQSVSKSGPGEQIKLDPITDWGSVLV